MLPARAQPAGHLHGGLTTVVDTLINSDQATPDVTDASQRRRTWTLVVACAGGGLVIASMIALNAALGDIAVVTRPPKSN